MPSKNIIRKKKTINSRRARGVTSDLLNKMEEGMVTPPKVKTPKTSIKFHNVRKTSPIPIPTTPVLARPDGFYHDESKAALKVAESKMYKPKTPPSKLARIPTPEFFDHPPPEERERLRREASAELREAEARAQAVKMVENNRLVVEPKKRTFFNPFGLGNKKGKKSRKGKKTRKGKKYTLRK